jgi:hypothetical protein
MRWSEKLIEVIQKFGYTAVLVAIFALSVWVRVWQFPSIPAGLNQDEAAAGYESYSLLKTGMDKSGDIFPA